MLKRTARNRVLTEPGIDRNTVLDCIEALLSGRSKPNDVSPPIVKSVMSELNQRRKDALLHHRDAEAAKIDDILGELQYGPMKFQCDTPENPRLIRTRALTATTCNDPLNKTGSSLYKGTATLESIDIPTRHAVEPLLKTKRVREVSRSRYAKSLSIDQTVDSMIDYEVDSRRLAPRLQKVQLLEQKLAQAKADYDSARAQCYNQRQTFNAIQAAASDEMEIKLKDEMVELGSHVPTTLPLEFSHFSNKVLDARERSYRAAQIRKYEDASAIKKEAVQREKEELEANNEKFIRSYTLNKQHMQKLQDRKRESFQILWERKKEKNEWQIQQTIAQKKIAVQNLERELAEARNSADCELNRIRKNQRASSVTPVASRPKASTLTF